jgi:hypothetical protein
VPYRLNGSTLSLQPTKGKWVSQKPLDVDGNGHSLYAPVFEFEMSFTLDAPSDFMQLYNMWNNMSTGTVVATLPRFDSVWLSGTYEYFDYTGTILNQPERGEYYEGHNQNVVMMVTNVRI